MTDILLGIIALAIATALWELRGIRNALEERNKQTFNK